MTSSRIASSRAVVLASLFLIASVARAEPVQRSAAQALFDEARSLVEQGRSAEACPKFAESQRLEPASGTLLELALCLEKQGKTASAWVQYNEALTLASREGNHARQELARKSLSDLAPRLARLSLRLPEERPQGFWLKLDGVRLGEAAWGIALPVDPGEHVVEIGAPGRLDARVSVTATEPGQALLAQLPRLGTAPPVAPSPPAPVAQTRDLPDARAWRFKMGAGTSLGAGALALGAGVYFGLRARSEWKRREAHCDERGCDASAVAASEQAETFARTADVALGVGAAGLVVGTLLWVLAPKAKQHLSVTRRGLVLGGTF
jgi:hypothetical protein